MSKFKAGSGKWLTKGLFYETNRTAGLDPLYTLKDVDHKGFPSLRRLYMESNDPSEFAFATVHLGGWQHWKTLSEAVFFRPYIAQWREEMEQKMRSQSIELALKISEDTGASASARLNAAKFLANKGYNEGPKATKGRAKKKDIDAAARDIAATRDAADKDYKRVFGDE